MSKDISSNTTTMRYFQRYKDLFFITFGILTYSIGYTAFILPEKVGWCGRYISLAFLCFQLATRRDDLGFECDDAYPRV